MRSQDVEAGEEDDGDAGGGDVAEEEHDGAQKAGIQGARTAKLGSHYLTVKEPSHKY